MRLVIQIIAAICVALGVGLFVFGQSIMPDSSEREPEPNFDRLSSMFEDHGEQLVIASACRGVGAGVFMLGAVGLALTFVKGR